MARLRELPLPPIYDPETVGEVWRVPYQDIAQAAGRWRQEFQIQAAATDSTRIALIGIDVQNSFCIPGFELFVGGRSGTGAVEDNRRLCEFIYRNLTQLTHISATLDTHTAMQIFHPIFLVGPDGQAPAPYTLVSAEDVQSGRWRFNPALADSLKIDPSFGQRHLEHYTRSLQARGKYELTVWPYHVMLGSIGHALVAAFEQAIFFHTIARSSQPDLVVKGDNPLTENYSAIDPEVMEGPSGEPLAQRHTGFMRKLQEFDAVIVAGQAKSHCLAWTVADLLEDCLNNDPGMVRKVYLLEDCSSPVVVPGLVDYTPQADQAFQRFAAAGMHVVRSTTPMLDWPGL